MTKGWKEEDQSKKVEAYWLRNKDWFFKWNLTSNQVGLFDMKSDPYNDTDVSTRNAEMV